MPSCIPFHLHERQSHDPCPGHPSLHLCKDPVLLGLMPPWGLLWGAHTHTHTHLSSRKAIQAQDMHAYLLTPFSSVLSASCTFGSPAHNTKTSLPKVLYSSASFHYLKLVCSGRIGSATYRCIIKTHPMDDAHNASYASSAHVSPRTSPQCTSKALASGLTSASSAHPPHQPQDRPCTSGPLLRRRNRSTDTPTACTPQPEGNPCS